MNVPVEVLISLIVGLSNSLFIVLKHFWPQSNGTKPSNGTLARLEGLSERLHDMNSGLGKAELSMSHFAGEVGKELRSFDVRLTKIETGFESLTEKMKEWISRIQNSTGGKQ